MKGRDLVRQSVVVVVAEIEPETVRELKVQRTGLLGVAAAVEGELWLLRWGARRWRRDDNEAR